MFQESAEKKIVIDGFINEIGGGIYNILKTFQFDFRLDSQFMFIVYMLNKIIKYDCSLCN